jgi:hypothetical protein
MLRFQPAARKMKVECDEIERTSRGKSASNKADNDLSEEYAAHRPSDKPLLSVQSHGINIFECDGNAACLTKLTHLRSDSNSDR